MANVFAWLRECGRAQLDKHDIDHGTCTGYVIFMNITYLNRKVLALYVHRI
jgi:hypothetical protein